MATGVDADILLCAALAIAEARLTGADVVVATLVSPPGNRQGGLHVTLAARVESLLLQTGALGRVESLAPVAWAASAAGAEVDFADEAPSSLWTISTSANAPSLAIRYRAPLDSEAAALLADAVLRAIAGLLANRDGALNGIDIVDPAQLDRQLHDWNDTARPRSLRDTVQGRFEEMRHRSPDALAVVDATKSFTYAELDRRAAGLASRLRAEGVVAGDVVAVAMERSAGAVVAVLATLKAGAGYLPLDVSQPEERLAFTLDDAGVRVRSEEHTSELQSLMRISYAVLCLKKKKLKARVNPDNKQHQPHTNYATSKTRN